LTDALDKLALSCTFALRNGTLEPIDSALLDSPVLGDFVAGAMIDGKYKILSLIGKGGMGAVFKVHHVLLQKDMALKTFRSQCPNHDTWQRFQREARAIAKLKHQNIVEVFDFGIARSTLPYYTMELLEGESLAERLSRAGRIDPPRALHIFLEAAEALAYAHRQQIVHRDIKPGNIFLRRESEAIGAPSHVKIVDFGIAKLAEDSSAYDEQAITQSGTIFGSPLYMSPEQSQGLPVDQRTDIYSFGCALFEAIVGAPPFVGETALATMVAHQSKEPPRLKELLPETVVPQRLEQLIARLLAKTPAKRYQTFEQVVAEIKYCLEDLQGDRANKVLPASPSRKVKIGDFLIDTDTLVLKPGARWLKIVAGFFIVAAIGGALSVLLLGPPVKQPVRMDSSISVLTDSPASSKYIADPYKAERLIASRDSAKFYRGTTSDGRIYQFPDYWSIGSFVDEEGHQIVPCLKKVVLPLEYLPRFSAEQETFLSPELLQRFAPDGLEALELRLEIGASREWNDSQLVNIVGIKTLRELNLSGNQSITAGCFQYIDQLPALSRIDLTLTGVDGKDLTKLKRLGQLRRLCVNRNKLISPLFRFMAEDPARYHLNCLIASNCEITDFDLLQLSKIRTIEELRLSGNKISNRGLAYLAALPHLTILKVKDNQLDVHAFEAINKLKELRVLEISDKILTREQMQALNVSHPNCVISLQRHKTGSVNPKDF
jgi:serine/threonine protein kinase